MKPARCARSSGFSRKLAGRDASARVDAALTLLCARLGVRAGAFLSATYRRASMAATLEMVRCSTKHVLILPCGASGDKRARGQQRFKARAVKNAGNPHAGH